LAAGAGQATNLDISDVFWSIGQLFTHRPNARGNGRLIH